MNAFNTEAIKLGVMGATIVVATGDDGANGAGSSCGYSTSFPATSPYVTAVGGTMGPESGLPEVVMSSSLGSQATSGGGFSTLASAFPQQKAAIAHYFKSVASAPPAGYSTTGRGIPDLSVAGYHYRVILAGGKYVSSGTSVSAPVFAGMVSLVNAARKKAVPAPLLIPL
eukprot:gene4374-biopygen4711